jgi:hypothetical protein
MCSTASNHSGDHFYEVSLKFLHAVGDLLQTKIGCGKTARQGENHNTTRFSNGRLKTGS